jgi:hypothetical protein
MNKDDISKLTLKLIAFSVVTGIAAAATVAGVWVNNTALIAAGVVTFLLAAYIVNMVETHVVERFNS